MTTLRVVPTKIKRYIEMMFVKLSSVMNFQVAVWSLSTFNACSFSGAVVGVVVVIDRFNTWFVSGSAPRQRCPPSEIAHACNDPVKVS